MKDTEERYVLWNYMLAEQCLLTDSHHGAVLLTVTPQILAAALEEAKEGLRTPEESESDFVASVAQVYKERVLHSADRLRGLKSCNDTEVPFCLGFLALSVLAAYHMHTDSKHTSRAYYVRLGEMLGCELVGTFPAGFDGDAFLELWDELGQWLESKYGRRLAVPKVEGTRRFVAYPLQHVPLRQVDIQRLPHFFDGYSYEPGVRAPLDRLAYDLYGGAGPWPYLTKAGKRALEDPGRRPFVIRQVAHELEHWDGYRVDSSGARIATIELYMDVRRRRPQLSLLARRPQGFPELIENGEIVFQSSYEGWYEPVLIGPDDSALLSEGLRVRVGNRYLLQLRPSCVVPLTPSGEFAGYVSDRVLRADTRCAVLCEESIVEEVASFVEAINNGRVYPRRDESLPRGWCLFTDIHPSATATPPAGLDSLRIESSLALVPLGGLRLGRRWTWLEGAPARITVVGAHQGLEARIDGQGVVPGSDGSLPSSLLSVAGPHVVEIGNRLRQRITVLPGTVNPECRSWEYDEIQLSRTPVAIPEGNWVLVGLVPGQSENVVASSSGTLVRPTFCASWALKIGAGPSAVALHIHDVDLSENTPKGNGTQSPQSARSRAKVLSIQSWAEAIYQAGIRRPRLLCSANCKAQDLAAEWRRLLQKARSVKRQMKKGRR